MSNFTFKLTTASAVASLLAALGFATVASADDLKERFKELTTLEKVLSSMAAKKEQDMADQKHDFGETKAAGTPWTKKQRQQHTQQRMTLNHNHKTKRQRKIAPAQEELPTGATIDATPAVRSGVQPPRKHSSQQNIKRN